MILDEINTTVDSTVDTVTNTVDSTADMLQTQSTIQLIQLMELLMFQQMEL